MCEPASNKTSSSGLGGCTPAAGARAETPPRRSCPSATRPSVAGRARMKDPKASTRATLVEFFKQHSSPLSALGSNQAAQALSEKLETLGTVHVRVCPLPHTHSHHGRRVTTTDRPITSHRAAGLRTWASVPHRAGHEAGELGVGERRAQGGWHRPGGVVQRQQPQDARPAHQHVRDAPRLCARHEAWR